MTLSTLPIVDWLNTPLATIRAEREALRTRLRSPLPRGMTCTETADGALDFIPAGHLEPVPILYFHGGGFVSGSARTHFDLCAWLAETSRRRLLSAPYPLAPESRYPVQRDGARATLARFGSPVILAGDSAGAAVALWAEGGAPDLVRAILCLYPALGLRDSVSIRTRGTPRSGLTPEVIRFFYDSLGATAEQMADDIQGSAPVIAVLATQDPFADDARHLARVLATRGRDVQVIEAHGFAHEAGAADSEARRFLPVVAKALTETLAAA